MAKKKRAKKRPSDKVLAPDQVVWRDSNGNFCKGNPGGPGRPFQRQERFLATLNDTVTTAKWIKIVKRAVEQAEDGDRYARDWLSKWLLGQPESMTPDQKRTIIDVLTDGSFVSWIESGGRNGDES